MVPQTGLHMTLERIAYEDEISPRQLDAVAEAATRSCRAIAPLEITVGDLGGTSGAIGFSAYPRQPINDLRNSLRAATVDAHPTARLRPGAFHPHVTIAYCNTADIPAAPVVTAVKNVNTYPVALTVGSRSLAGATFPPSTRLCLDDRLPAAALGHLSAGDTRLGFDAW
jgi:2'-5' RNA ligase